MKVTVHQVEHLVWLGLLDKFNKSNIIVLADTFDFKKNYFENRNRIRTSEGESYVTIPVESHNHKPINQIKIASVIDWKEKYLNKITVAYCKSPYFNQYFSELSSIILNARESLFELNYELIIKVLEWFNIKKPIILSSTLELNSSLRSSERLLEICKKVNATEYLSGISGKDYLDLNIFKEANINVSFHEFVHPVYKQQYEPFMPGMSSIDYLFNCGGKP